MVSKLGFVILADSNEVGHGTAYTFEDIYDVERGEKHHIPIDVVKFNLPMGDYCISRKQNAAVVERKTEQDFYACLTSQRVHFEEQVSKMNSSNILFPFIVVEQDLSRMDSRLQKNAFRTYISWCMKYPRVHWVFMPNRRAAEICTFRILEKGYDNS
jgi:ERCC4-type nuclease